MCKWESKYDVDYKCHDAPSIDDLCLLHSKDENKNIQEFAKKVEERMTKGRLTSAGWETDKIGLRGCYFPKDFPAEYFKNHTFEKPVDFSEATFSQDANFSEAKFIQNVNFHNAVFSGSARFFKTYFEREAKFTGTIFKEDANFDQTNFKGSVDFTWTEFRGWTFFFKNPRENSENPVTLGNPTTFKPTRFLGEVVLEDVDLSQCSFLHSNIEKVDFRYCKFGEIEERLFKIIPHIRQNVLKDELDCDKAPNKDYEPVHRLYLELKKNFEEKRDWNRAGDFHYGEMECRRKMEGWLGRNILSLEALYYWASGYGKRPPARWVALEENFLWLYYWASGYGERPLRAAFWLSVLLFGCALGFIWEESTPITIGQSASGTSWGDTFFNFWDKFWYSIKVSTLLAHKAEVMEPLSRMGKVIFALEAISGPLLIALFILALRRKVKR